MVTSLCKLHPLELSVYIVKLGFTGIYIFLIVALKHRLKVLFQICLNEAVFKITHALSSSMVHVRFLCGKLTIIKAKSNNQSRTNGPINAHLTIAQV